MRRRGLRNNDVDYPNHKRGWIRLSGIAAKRQQMQPGAGLCVFQFETMTGWGRPGRKKCGLRCLVTNPGRSFRARDKLPCWKYDAPSEDCFFLAASLVVCTRSLSRGREIMLLPSRGVLIDAMTSSVVHSFALHLLLLAAVWVMSPGGCRSDTHCLGVCWRSTPARYHSNPPLLGVDERAKKTRATTAVCRRPRRSDHAPRGHREAMTRVKLKFSMPCITIVQVAHLLLGWQLRAILARKNGLLT